MASSLHEDRERALSFGADAERYHRSRPRYPDALLDHLVPGGSGPDVLDVGTGTGIVADGLAARGATVLGLEPDARMAAVARSSGHEVVEATIEAWDARGRRFDLLTAGQAWHWVDPAAGARRAAEVLHAGGRIALFWNVAAPAGPAAAALRDVYARHAPGLDAHSVLLGTPLDDRLDGAAAALSASGRFTHAHQRTLTWSQRRTTQEWLDVLPTHSDHATLAPDARRNLLAAVAAALDELGGGLELEYTTWLVEAARR